MSGGTALATLFIIAVFDAFRAIQLGCYITESRFHSFGSNSITATNGSVDSQFQIASKSAQ
jgi:hypothetical protein